MLLRPSQKNQLLRKGKRAWRKHTDIEEVERGMEKVVDELVAHGAAVDELANAELFEEDTAGQAARAPTKTLRLTEILARRSKAPGLVVERNQRKPREGVLGKQIHRLMETAGRVQGTTAAQAKVAKDGLVQAGGVDPWAAEAPETRPEVVVKRTATLHTRAKVAPRTLARAPVQMQAAVGVPAAGKLYNPLVELWKALVLSEYARESTREAAREKLMAHMDKVRELVARAAEKEESEGESEEEQEEEEEEHDPMESLSVNAPVEVKIKTRADRNREKRHRERMQLEAEVKDLKRQIRELETWDPAAPVAVTTPLVEGKERRKHRLGKYRPLDPALEVKLLDELGDSLRRVVPEGNLLYDQMRRLQHSGQVEARLPVAKKRRYAPKITEKWTYKDFK